MPSKRYLRWRREMIDAYHDARLREILAPLAAAARIWENGDISNEGLLDEVNNANREARSFDRSFIGDHDTQEQLIRDDEGWYISWVQAHPQPEDDDHA